MRTSWAPVWALAALAVAGVALLVMIISASVSAGCASTPLPAPTTGRGHDIHMQFKECLSAAYKTGANQTWCDRIFYGTPQ